MTRPRRSAFTLIELLVVLFIIGILMSLLLPVMAGVRNKADRARASTQIDIIRNALTSYLADHRRYPRLSGYATPEDLLRNDAPALYAALRNHPSHDLGGGQSGPYLETWGRIGVVEDPTRLEAASMGLDGNTGIRELDEDERVQAQTVPFQQAHAPRGLQPLVLLDPWGAPYVYREWAGVRDSAKQALVVTPIPRSGFSLPPNGGGPPPVPGPVDDKPRNLSGVDIWSFGPNGVNEFGAGDDVSSWHSP